MIVLREFGRGEAEKLVTDQENYRSDNFVVLGEWVVKSISIGVPKGRLDPRLVHRAKGSQISKIIKFIRIAVTHLNHLSLYVSQVAW